MRPGLYKLGKLLKTWDELIFEGIVAEDNLLKTASFKILNKMEINGTLVIPEYITNIGRIDHCYYMDGIIFPSETLILSYEFLRGCILLTEIKCPKVNQICAGFASNNPNLEKVYLGHPYWIGCNSLCDCPNLKSIIYDGTIEEFMNIHFTGPWGMNTNPLCKVICDDGEISVNKFHCLKYTGEDR